MPSYSQFGEDVEIAKLFPEGYAGRYVDVGSGHPISGSNTYLLYTRGWRGLCVDPVGMHYSMHKRERPEDTMLQCAVSDFTGGMVFYERPDCPTVSTAVTTYAGGNSLATNVPVFTMADLIRDYNLPAPDLMSVDVEGVERSVLEGTPFEQGWLPKVIVIESCLPCTSTPCHDEWEHILSYHGYSYRSTHGVNRIYIAKGFRS